ncbi:MAG: MBOAT family protein [Bacteroidetes bacterium]|nr:MAG: MBOAT family protein [Bacteroidota bacterium]
MLNWEKISELFIYNPKAPLLFNSGAFFLLFMVFFGIYILLHKADKLRIAYTLLFSLFFYYKSSGFYFWVLILSTFIDFYIGNALYKMEDGPKRKALLILSLCSNLGLLAYFKYVNFGIQTYNDLTGNAMPLTDIFLPVGISFYTFQTLSYSIDIYRRNLEPAKNIVDFGFFVSFFPQLVAGPIVRAADFIPQIYQKLSLTKSDMSRAFLLIAGGLVKKAIISDYLSVNFVDRVFDNPLLYSAFENLTAVYAYAFQIYCDFSGYSDMAIGLSLLMGFKLPDNFRSPYQSTSITEFWRRWHISLSSWLRDYLYISLGGNRKGQVRTYVNLLLTMLIGGLWHGASWKFVIWGALHGSLLAIEKFIWSIIPSLKGNKWARVFGFFFTFHFVCFAWIYFRASSFDQAVLVIKQIGLLQIDWAQIWTIIQAYQHVFGVLVLALVLHFIPERWEQYWQRYFEQWPMFFKASYLAVCIWIVMQVSRADVQPFIYFQF